jgi:hypothetical protein
MSATLRGLLVGWFCLAALPAMAQPPGNRPGAIPGGDDPEMFVARLMNLDQNGDGQLSKSEVTDQRLQTMLARADADGDGSVSKEELTTAMAKEMAARGQGGPGGAGFGGRGPGGRGPGGPGGGPGGPGGPGFGPPPKVGQILPDFLQESLDLTARQKKMLEVLQADVDKRLAKILTDEQRKQIEEMQTRGPGGPAAGPPPDGGNRTGKSQRPPDDSLPSSY